MNQPDTTPTQDATSRPAARPKLHGRVDRLANYLRKLAGRSPGDIAALRRMKPNGVPPPIFWSIFPPNGERAEKRWAVLCAAMAHDPELHTSSVQTGRALAECGLNERRFEALLRAREGTLHHLVRTLGHYLAAKRVRIDWGDIAWLLLSEQAAPRKKLARAFYAAAHDKKNG